jgi:hypothetical protein
LQRCAKHATSVAPSVLEREPLPYGRKFTVVWEVDVNLCCRQVVV